MHTGIFQINNADVTPGYRNAELNIIKQYAFTRPVLIYYTIRTSERCIIYYCIILYSENAIASHRVICCTCLSAYYYA